MSLQDSNQTLFTLQCLLSTSNGYPGSLFPAECPGSRTPRFSGPDSVPPASSFVSTCKQRQTQSRHKQFPKVNFSFGNQFPFRNQVQTFLAWAVKETYWKRVAGKLWPQKQTQNFLKNVLFWSHFKHNLPSTDIITLDQQITKQYKHIPFQTLHG